MFLTQRANRRIAAAEGLPHVGSGKSHFTLERLAHVLTGEPVPTSPGHALK